jgi:hypothetical protein
MAVKTIKKTIKSKEISIILDAETAAKLLQLAHDQGIRSDTLIANLAVCRTVKGT